MASYVRSDWKLEDTWLREIHEIQVSRLNLSAGESSGLEAGENKTGPELDIDLSRIIQQALFVRISYGLVDNTQI